MNYSDEYVFMQKRIRELEERLDQLRLSRRVLMNLVEKMEKEKASVRNRMEKENKKLLQTNYRYARSLLCKNRKIVELELKLHEQTPSKSAN